MFGVSWDGGKRLMAAMFLGVVMMIPQAAFADEATSDVGEVEVTSVDPITTDDLVTIDGVSWS